MLFTTIQDWLIKESFDKKLLFEVLIKDDKGSTKSDYIWAFDAKEAMTKYSEEHKDTVAHSIQIMDLSYDDIEKLKDKSQKKIDELAKKMKKLAKEYTELKKDKEEEQTHLELFTGEVNKQKEDSEAV